MDMEGALMVLVNVCAVIHIQGMIVDRHKLVLMKVVVNCPVASNVMAMDIAKQILQYASVIKNMSGNNVKRKMKNKANSQPDFVYLILNLKLKANVYLLENVIALML